MGQRSEHANLAVSVAVQANQPVLLWGPPGTGKTSSLRAIGAALDFHVEVIVGSIREATDFAGLPVLDGSRVRLVPPAWAVDAVERDRYGVATLVVLDELTTAPPSVQAAMLRIVLDRVVGEVQLPATVAVVAAANPAEDAADGYELAAALANRFCHLDWPVDTSSWCDGLVNGWVRALASPLPPRWQDARPAWRGRVGGFIRHRPDLLFAQPDDHGLRGRAWPSPRSWEMAATLAAAADAADPSGSVVLDVVAGCVGEGAAIELLTWVEQANLPDPEALLDEPALLALPMRTDRLFAALGGVVAAVAAEPSRERFEGAWEIVERTVAEQPDVAATAALGLLELRDPRWPLPSSFDSLEPMITAASAADR